ncbi:MAG: VWA domain-containing protein [Bacteroidales bacterium]
MIALLLVASLFTLRAWQTSTAQEQQATFKTGVDLVRIDALVTVAGEPVAGLGPNDFEVIDNGVPQKVEMAGPESRFNVILVLDVSGSVKGERLTQLVDGVSALLGQLKTGEQASLVAFNDDVALRVPMTADAATVKRALANIQPGGDTSMFDALFSSLSLAADNMRSLVLLYSDGADNASWLSGAQVIDLARRADVVICPVAVGVSPGSTRRSALFLEAVADQTGGRLFHAEATKPLRTSMVQVLTEFRSRYLIGYVPSGVGRDDGWHKVELRVKGRKANVRAKDGYMSQR